MAPKPWSDKAFNGLFPEPKLTIEQANEFLVTNPSGRDVLNLIAEAFDGEIFPGTVIRIGSVLGWNEDQTLQAMALYACIHIQTLKKQLTDYICAMPPRFIVNKDNIMPGEVKI